MLFMMMIFLPYLFAHRVGEQRVSETENRMLSSYPSLVIDGKWNPFFPKEFETWLQDNLRGRTVMVELFSTLQYNLFDRVVKSDVLQGKNGWLFYKDDNSIREYQHLNLLSEETANAYAVKMQELSGYLQERGIAFYYLQCFDKESIYPDEYAQGVYQIGSFSRADQILDILRSDTEVNTISVKERMKQLSDEQIYFPYSDLTHWNEKGAYEGYRCLMQAVCHDFSQVQILEENDYEIEQVQRETNLYGFSYPFEEYAPIYRIKKQMASEITDETQEKWAFLQYKEHTHEYINPACRNDLRMLLIGDSFIRQFIKDDIAEGFAHTLSVDWLNISILDEVIAVYQPDIVVFESAESALKDTVPLVLQLDFIK